MSVDVRLTAVPEGCKGWNTSCDWSQKGRLAEVPYGQRPWVAGELWQIRGWFEGLGGAAITGWLEFVLHEGLTTATGDVTIYDKRT